MGLGLRPLQGRRLSRSAGNCTDGRGSAARGWFGKWGGGVLGPCPKCCVLAYLPWLFTGGCICDVMVL